MEGLHRKADRGHLRPPTSSAPTLAEDPSAFREPPYSELRSKLQKKQCLNFVVGLLMHEFVKVEGKIISGEQSCISGNDHAEGKDVHQRSRRCTRGTTRAATRKVRRDPERIRL